MCLNTQALLESNKHGTWGSRANDEGVGQCHAVNCNREAGAARHSPIYELYWIVQTPDCPNLAFPRLPNDCAGSTAGFPEGCLEWASSAWKV